jgi:hypothetical protein
MPDHTSDDPREQVRQLYAEARRAFAQDVDDVLTEIRVFSASLEHAIGEVGPADAWQALRGRRTRRSRTS